jgi:hypothetical protein
MTANLRVSDTWKRSSGVLTIAGIASFSAVSEPPSTRTARISGWRHIARRRSRRKSCAKKMWPLISPASGGVGLAHLGLDQRVAGLPHQRGAAQFGDAVEQRLARLHIGDDGGAGLGPQHRFGEDAEQLVAPDDAALAVDRAEPIAVAVKGETEVEVLLGHQAASDPRGSSPRWDRMVVGEAAVDLGEDGVMLAGQELYQAVDDRAGRAVAASQPIRNAPPA